MVSFKALCVIALLHPPASSLLSWAGPVFKAQDMERIQHRCNFTGLRPYLASVCCHANLTCFALWARATYKLCEHISTHWLHAGHVMLMLETKEWKLW